MVNIKSADLTSSGQKAIAGIVLVLVLVILYFVLPPLITILTNLWIAAIIGIPLGFFIYNYQIIWSIFKKLSWEMTKKIISADPLWHMYQYYYYMQNKLKELQASIVEVGGIYTKTERSIADMAKQLKDLQEEAIQHEKRGSSASIIKLVGGKVGLLQKQIDNFLPKLEFIKTQKKALTELYDAWSVDTELLKDTLDSKAQEYELMKTLNKANTSAMAFLQKDSPELREYKQSLIEIENQVSDYTANMENFQREVAPQLSRMAVTSSINEADGAAIIEQYKQKRLTEKL